MKKTDFANVKGRVLEVYHADEGDHISNILRKGSVYEKDEIEAFKHFWRPGMVVLDIGANIGSHSFFFAEHMKEQEDLICFEPFPQNAQILRRNLSPFSNITVIEAAVGAKSTVGKKVKAKVLVAPANMGDHRVRKDDKLLDEQIPRDVVEVDVVTLDEILPDIKTYEEAFLKLDVQGCEKLVFEGATAFLGHFKKLLIIMEFWPNGLREVGHDPAEFLEWLFQHFQIYSKWSGFAEIKKMDAQLFMKKLGKNNHINLLLIKRVDNGKG